MPLISPTTLLVAGSISITLSPAALVCTIRTVAAPRARGPASDKARIRESLVFIATHFKLPGHVVDLLFRAAVPAGAGARLRCLQGDRAAAADREASGACPLHYLPFDRDGVPADSAS